MGDKVRLSQSRRAFRKGYLPQSTTETFTVNFKIPTDPFTYEIVEHYEENIVGKFYAEELKR